MLTFILICASAFGITTLINSALFKNRKCSTFVAALLTLGIALASVAIVNIPIVLLVKGMGYEIRINQSAIGPSFSMAVLAAWGLLNRKKKGEAQSSSDEPPPESNQPTIAPIPNQHIEAKISNWSNKYKWTFSGLIVFTIIIFYIFSIPAKRIVRPIPSDAVTEKNGESSIDPFDEWMLERLNESTRHEDLIKFSKQGHVKAQFILGKNYKDGRGVPVNYSAAEQWLKLAAEKGSLDALYLLGEMNFEQLKNPTEGIHWYRKAAMSGHPKSQSALGLIYSHGPGVRIDLIEAYVWYSLAEVNGELLSEYRRKTIESKLSSTQIARAQMLAQKLHKEIESGGALARPEDR